MPTVRSKEIKGTRVRWVDVTRTGKEELAFLKRQFKFLDTDLKECPPPNQRSKLIERPDYIFMIILIPVFDRQSMEIKPVELDLFIGTKFLVTIHNLPLESLTSLFRGAETNKQARMHLLGEGPAKLLYQILDNLLAGCFPMLVHLEQDVDGIEERMTQTRDRGTIHEIFRIKTNIINFKKAMQPHKMVIRKLIAVAPRLFKTERLVTYAENLVEHTKEIWDELESTSRTLDAIEDTHLSLLNFRANDVIRLLTIFAVIVFPLTLVASTFGMNTKNTPIIGMPYDFWIIIGVMILSTCGMLTFFKLKKWF